METTFNIESLDFTFLDDGRSIRINTEYYFLLDGKQMCIPAGWVSDGASIPRFLWCSLGSPFVGKHRAGCILHDFLYWSNYQDRKFSDVCMYDMMRADGTAWVRASLIYRGVRMGGWVAWNNHKKRKDK
jgi:hypothetical protein